MVANVRTPEQIAIAEEALFIHVSDLPENLDQYYSSHKTAKATQLGVQDQIKLVAGLRSILRNKNYDKPGKLESELERITVDANVAKKAMGQLVNLPTAVKREVFGFDKNITDAGVEQAFQYWVSGSSIVLDLNGDPATDEKATQIAKEITRAPSAKKEPRILGEEYDPNMVEMIERHAAQAGRPVTPVSPTEDIPIYKSLDFNTQGFEAIVQALGNGFILRNIDVGFFTPPENTSLLDRAARVLTRTSKDKNAVSADAVVALAKILPALDADTLSFRAWNGLEEGALNAVIAGMANNGHIRILDISGSKVSENTGKALGRMLAENKGLLSVVVDNCFFDVHAFKPIHAGVEKNHNIIKFDISRASSFVPGSKELGSVRDIAFHATNSDAAVEAWGTRIENILYMHQSEADAAVLKSAEAAEETGSDVEPEGPAVSNILFQAESNLAQVRKNNLKIVRAPASPASSVSSLSGSSSMSASTASMTSVGTPSSPISPATSSSLLSVPSSPVRSRMVRAPSRETPPVSPVASPSVARKLVVAPVPQGVDGPTPKPSSPSPK